MPDFASFHPLRPLRLRRLIALVLLAAAAGVVPAAAQDSRGAPQDDQTVEVSKGHRFTLETLKGSVIVHAWEKDAVRLRSWHSAAGRPQLRVQRSGIVTIDTDDSRGPQQIDYEITVPRWMPVSIETTYDDITIDGTSSDVSAESVRGSIAIKGGSGAIHAETVEGHVTIEGVKGHVEATSVNDDVRLDGVSGEVTAETTNGGITLAKIESDSVEATTINGNISYQGSITDDGHYEMTTHNGDILVSIPEGSNVTLEVRTYQGSFRPEVPVKGSTPTRRGGRGTYVVGTGSAQMELDSFGGSVRLIGTPGRK